MLSLLVALAVGAGDPPVDFQRDVLPVLSERCFECHGPDEATREADLRLDRGEDLFEDRGGYAAIVPGDVEQSELWLRVSDELDGMPPAEAGERLSAEELAVLRAWIEEGAPWALHWSYVPPARPTLPAEAGDPWVQNPVDAFVLARLRAEGLAPSPEADRATLLRRASIHLTGLPPSPEEVDALLASDDPGAYESEVDRLLSSTAHAEHMARMWLDLARYADTNGYEKDESRTMWRWRDWVIDAFAQGMPFDQFTIEQLAGDLLPEPSTEQLVATGFHRNTMLNREGGTDPEEFRVAAVLDRVNTTSQVWLGETLGCCQCHSHKYDPFTQREYYELLAFFDSTQDDGKDYAPLITAPTRAQRTEIERLEAELAGLSGAAAAPDPVLDAAQRAWEVTASVELDERPAWQVLWPLAATAEQGTELDILDDGSVLAGGPRPDRDVYTLDLAAPRGEVTALRLETLRHPSHPRGGVGRSSDGNFVLSGVEVALLRDGDERPVPIAAGSSPYRQTNIDHRPVRAIDGDDGTGWAVAPYALRDDVALTLLPAAPLVLEDGDALRVRVRQLSPYASYLVGRLRVATTSDPRLVAELEPLEWGAWRVTDAFEAASHEEAYETAYAPERGEAIEWREAPGYTDGGVHSFSLPVGALYLARMVTAPRARRVLLRLGSDDSLKLWVNGALAHESFVGRGVAYDQERVEVELPAGESEVLLKIVNQGGPAGFSFAPDEPARRGPPEAVLAALHRPPSERDAAEARALRDWYRREVSESGRQRYAVLALLERELEERRAAAPTALVMRERDEPRTTHVLKLGSFLSPGEAVGPAVPAVLNPWPEGEPLNRLGLARWLVSPENPLTARATVNRLWERVFGTGIVATSNDLGLQGEHPTHPALLDWLAVELVEGGWDTREILRTIVTSATYRQRSETTPELVERDPANRLYARGPRTRLEAEVLRDVALAAAGLLSDEVGGPSVFPPQPEGTWAMTYSGEQWETDLGEGRFRRGLYTFWRRTAPYPTFMLFDAPSRELVCTRRARTNTPLQALAVLNDPVFVEAAAGLARRMMDEGGAAADAIAARGFRLCVARAPEPGELSVLVGLFDEERARLAADPDSAQALAQVSPVLPVGDRDAVDLAAWTVVANVLLNLDETVTVE